MDFLNKYTKEELILWIKKKCFALSVKESDLMLTRYYLEGLKIQALSDKSRDKLKSLDGKKADKLAKRFNETTHDQVKIKIAEELQKHHKELDDWWKEEQRISKMRDKHFKYHEQIIKQMKTEQKQSTTN